MEHESEEDDEYSFEAVERYVAELLTDEEMAIRREVIMGQIKIDR